MGPEKHPMRVFDANQIKVVGEALEMAEEIISNAFQMTSLQWHANHFDVKTLAELDPQEISSEHFAQIIRYQGKKKEDVLGTSTFDLYKICLQDHVILNALENSPALTLFPFALYLLCHELIHVVRFVRFLQGFETTFRQRMEEEKRVHQLTEEILEPVRISGIGDVIRFQREENQPPMDSGVLDFGTENNGP